MTGTSHAITGAVIAASIKEPVVALPLAFVSHYICDMLPHIGTKNIKDVEKRECIKNRIYLIDFCLICIFFIVLFLVGAPWVVLAGAFLAGIPDIVWFYRYIFKEKILQKTAGSMNTFNQWHVKIQWSETIHYGLPFELVYSTTLVIILSKLL